MNDPIGQLPRLPLTLAVGGAELLVRTLRGARVAGAASETMDWRKERPLMTDRELENDDVKLVQYSIVSVKRGRERELENGDGQRIVTENITGEAFATWMVADYIQRYPDRIPHDEKRYLRVYYSILDRWARESLQYEEQQLDVLRGIERAIRDCCPPGTMSDKTTTGTAPPTRSGAGAAGASAP